MTFSSQDFSCKYISQSYQDVLQQYKPTGSLLYVLDGTGSVVFTLPYSSVGNTLVTSDITSSMTVLSASYALNGGGTGGDSLQTGSLYPITASWAISSSYAITSDSSNSASYASSSLSSSWSTTSLTSSYGLNFTASSALTVRPAGSEAGYIHLSGDGTGSIDLYGGMLYGTASMALTSSYVELTTSSSWASSSLSSSYAINSTPIRSGIVSGSEFGASISGVLTASISFTRPFQSELYSVSVTADESPRIWLATNRSNSGFVINSGESGGISGIVMWQAIYVGEYN